MDTWGGNDARSLHKYLYTHADPVNGIDPSGNITMSEVAGTFTVKAILIRAGIGSIIGAIDAKLRGRSFADGVIPGAIGGVVAPLIPLKLGIAFAVTGISYSIANGHYTSAFFQVATAGSGWLFATRGFSSFRNFKATFGPAGLKRQWHHIVEQDVKQRPVCRNQAEPS